MARSMIPLLLLWLCMACLEAPPRCTCAWTGCSTKGRADTTDSLPHLNPTKEATWMALLPRKLGSKAEFDWLAFYRSFTRGGDDLAPDEFLSRASHQTNLEYLLYLNVDRLTWSFRQQAGLPTTGEQYGGWEAPDGQLCSHFGGHYLNAHMWERTHKNTLWEKMTIVVDILIYCQRKMGTGYLSAYPETMFDMYEEISEAWSPYSTIHKIVQGLLDQYT